MTNVLAKAADSAACAMLNDIGSAGTQLGVWTMWNPKVAMVPLAVGGLSYLANRLLCPQQEFDPGSGPDPNIDGCKKGQPGWGGKIYWYDKDGKKTTTFTNNNANEIVEVLFERQFNGLWGHQILFTTDEGMPMYFNSGVSENRDDVAGTTYFVDGPGLACEVESHPDDPVPPQPDLPPYEYTDPDTNCNYTVKFEGFAQITPDGEARPVWTISGGETTRADGGVIGGCNLSPTIYVQGGEGGGSGGDGGDGPIPPIPYPPNPPVPGPDGVPWWAKAIAAGATGALLNQIAEGIKDLAKPSFNEGSFTLTAPCDVDENGDPQTRTWEFLEGSFEERMNAHQVALMEIMQQHLDWKTPTCGCSEKPQLEGTWISTRWISDGNSPGGERPLRKLFRYRSKSTLTDEQLRDYWADFSWQAGPVCVTHKGAWWGNPQVWAATSEEGQRVLRFAAAEAGLDPDQAGEWLIGSSRSPRYGMPGTMRLDKPYGTYWVTRRDGPSQESV